MHSSHSRKTVSKTRSAYIASAIERLESRRLLSTVVVNTTADSTDPKGSSTVSLRDAIAVANAATSATTITFSTTVFASAKTITLGGTQLEFRNTKEATTITGPTVGVTISGNDQSAVFLVDSGVTASLSRLIVTKGHGVNGGGIHNEGTLSLTDDTLTGNVVNKGVGDGSGGGGLYNEGTATLADDTITNNSVTNAGGGIYNSRLNEHATIYLTNVTVSGNTASGWGGGGIFNYGTATIANSTVSQNGTSGKYGGGGILDGGNSTAGTVYLSNDIVAGNTSTSGLGPDVADSFNSQGFNLIGKTDGGTGFKVADLTGTIAKPLNADLGNLSNNGGPTQTLLPLTGSPAIDKGSNSLIPSGVTTDQRGLPRTYNGTVDIGAVEVQPLIQIKAPGGQSATQNVSKSVTLGSFTQYTNATLYKDVITWGDGSASTTLSLTAAGTIPATAHAFAKTGTITVTEVITDAKGNKSNTVTFTETVTAPPSSIAGTVFDDANGDGKIDNGEFGVGLWTVYLDLNNNGKLDTGDKSTTTDINGKFSFTNLAAGTYTVRVVPVTGTSATKPTGNALTIALAAGQNSTGNLFGEKATA